LKLFLIKIFYFFSIVFSLIGSLVFYYYKKSDLPFNSNSLCFNAKEKFILEHNEEIKKCKYFVIGSSMGLNNIDCILLSQQIGQKVVNLSSSGMKFNNFMDFDIWNKNTVVVLNMNFTDFGKGLIKIFPKHSSRVINILKDFTTFRSQINSYDISLKLSKKNDTFYSLNFDDSGSIIFADKENFKIDSTRWDFIGYGDTASEKDLKNFVNDIRNKSTLVKKIIITFSPTRKTKYNMDRSYLVHKLEDYLKEVPNVIFFDNYDISGFSDSEFVDVFHFSKQGSKLYTELISKQINSKE